MEVTDMMRGGCFCGAIRYEFDSGDYPAANCHCTMCRRIHAAPFVSWLVVPTPQFRYTAGRPAMLRSSDRGTRYFCSSCGTHVVCINDAHPDVTDVAVGSLDAPESVSVGFDVHTDTRLPWLKSQGS
jgi:hypothetical protein